MTFTNFGCVNTGAPWKSSDGTTNKVGSALDVTYFVVCSFHLVLMYASIYAWFFVNNQYWCDRTGMHDYTTGIIASSSTGQLSIPKEFRIYAANGCKNCFPASYSLEGRVDAASAWVEIASGDFP